MAVSPADFYAYSRATGVAIPDEPEERARMAPEVLEFRRNQLKAATPTGPDPLSVGLGIGLALAGGGAGVLAAQQALNRQKLSAVGGTRADLTRVKDFDLSRVPSVQQQAPTTETVVADLKPSKEISPRAYAESTGALAPKDDSFLQFSQRAEQIARETTPQDLTSVQRTQLPEVSQQAIEATDGGLDQVLQRNINTPSQRDTDFLRFSQRADAVAEQATVAAEQKNRIRAVADQIWGFEEELENLGLSAQKWLEKPNARELTDLGPSRGLSFDDIYERVNAAGSDYKVGTMNPLSAIERADLLDPDIPTEKVKYLLGNTLREQGGRVSTNLTYEVPGGAGITERGAETVLVGDAGSDVVAFNPRTGQFETDYTPDLEDINTGVKRFSNYDINPADYGDIEGPGGFVETRTFTERTKTGTSQVPGQVSAAAGAAPGSERMEREIDRVLPSRSTLEGDVARGFEFDPITGKLTLTGAATRGISSREVSNVAGRPARVIDLSKEGRAARITARQGQLQLDDPSYDPSSGGALTGRYQPATGEVSAKITSQPVTGFMSGEERLIKDAKGNWYVNQAKTKVTGSAPLKGYVGSDPNLRTLSLDRGEVNSILSNASKLWDAKGGGSALERQTFLIDTLNEQLQTQQGVKLSILQRNEKNRLDPAAFTFINEVRPGVKETSLYVKPAKVDAEGRPLAVIRQGQRVPLIDPEFEELPALQFQGSKKVVGAGGVAARDVDTSTYEGGMTFFSPTIETAPQRVLPGQGRPLQGQAGSVGSRPYLDTSPVGYRVPSPGSFARTQNPYTGAAAAAMGPAERVLSGNYQYPEQQLSFRLPPQSQSQRMERNLFSLTSNLTPGGRVVRGALQLGGGMGAIPAGVGSLSESQTISRYGVSGSQLQEVGNKLMAQASRKRGQQPGPTSATPAPEQGPATAPMQAPAPASTARPAISSTEMAGYARRNAPIPDVTSVEQQRADAVARHIGNYISAAAERMEGPASIQGVKLKGVGQNALRPYQAPSEAMIQQLMRMARRR